MAGLKHSKARVIRNPDNSATLLITKDELPDDFWTVHKDESILITFQRRETI